MSTIKIRQFRNSYRKPVDEDTWYEVMKDQIEAGNYQLGVIEYAPEAPFTNLSRESRMYVVANTSPRFLRNENNVADVNAPMYGECVDGFDVGVNLTRVSWRPIRYYLLTSKK